MRIIRWFLATNCRSKPYFKLRERALCQTTMLIDKLNEIKRLANQIQTPINKVTKWHTPARHAKTINPTIAVRLKWAQIRVWTSKLVIILEFRTAYSVRVCVAGCQVSWNGWKDSFQKSAIKRAYPIRHNDGHDSLRKLPCFWESQRERESWTKKIASNIETPKAISTGDGESLWSGSKMIRRNMVIIKMVLGGEK